MTLDDQERIAATRLASLPWMTVKRLRTLLGGGRPCEVMQSLTVWKGAGPHGGADISPALQALLTSACGRDHRRPLGDTWCDVLRESQPISSTLDSMDIRLLGDEDYPKMLACDPAAPAIIFTRGDIGALNRRRVGIVGTRHATAYGRHAAHHFGKVLAEHGVAVISGLARGIDGAAHRGVLAANHEISPDVIWGQPVGVVASGLDVMYPPEHADLWESIAGRGLLMTEAPPGTIPEPYRFPLRNRIIAGLSEVLLVIESSVHGGSLITVREAMDRGVTVMALPGATSTPASQGTNLLLRDGACVAIDPEDVLIALGLDTLRQLPVFDPRPLPLWPDGDVLALFCSQPLALDDVVSAGAIGLSMGFGDIALSLGRLEAQGWLTCTAGWFERVGLA